MPAQSHTDFICAVQSAIKTVFALRNICKPITVSAKEIEPRSVKLGHPAVACDPIDDPWTDKVGALSAEAARHPDNRGWLFDILPFARVATYTIGENEPLSLGPKANVG